MASCYYRHILWVFFALMLPAASFAQDLTADLNGFRLWQYKKAVEVTYGKPFESQKRNGYAFDAYQITDRSYMVIEHWEKYPDNIYSIQITRYPTTMVPCKGLILGDPASKVEKALGKPSRSKKIQDPSVTINYYDQANYSTEIDADGRLYSIKLHVTDEFMNKVDHDFDHWAAFRKAVLGKDMKAILELVRPDVEIFKDGDVLSINRRYDDFLAKPDETFVNALIGNHDSVLEELRKKEPEEEIRLAEKVGVGRVYKFYKGTILKEIVFFPYNGKYRVYEIAFRDNESKKTGK